MKLLKSKTECQGRDKKIFYQIKAKKSGKLALWGVGIHIDYESWNEIIRVKRKAAMQAMDRRDRIIIQ